MFLFCSHHVKRAKTPFPAALGVEVTRHGYVVKDSNGVTLASVYCRDDLQNWSFGTAHLTSDEARRIAGTIARIPELLNKNPAFTERGPVVQQHRHWRPTHPYHVALEDFFARERWDDIDACCRFNDVPFDATGEVFEREGKRWCTYHFIRQFDAIRFWDKFNGRWMLGNEFIYPERPKHLIVMKSLKGKGAV